MITWLSRFDSRKLAKLKWRLTRTPDAYNNSQCKSDSSVMHTECTYAGLMWWVYTVMNIYCSCIALATAKDSPERSVRIPKKLNESLSWFPNHGNILVISWDTWHPLEENAHAPSRTSSTVLVPILPGSDTLQGFIVLCQQTQVLRRPELYWCTLVMERERA